MDSEVKVDFVLLLWILFIILSSGSVLITLSKQMRVAGVNRQKCDTSNRMVFSALRYWLNQYALNSIISLWNVTVLCIHSKTTYKSILRLDKLTRTGRNTTESFNHQLLSWAHYFIKESFDFHSREPNTDSRELGKALPSIKFLVETLEFIQSLNCGICMLECGISVSRIPR